MRIRRFFTSLALAITLSCSPASYGSAPQSGGSPNPASTTSAAITADDLKTRLTVFANDSMAGREAGTLGNVAATDYLAAEARRLGLEPRGDDGTYFQAIPMIERGVDTSSAISVDGGELALWTDYAPVLPLGGFMIPFRVSTEGSLAGAQVIYAGGPEDLSREQIAGKLVLLGGLDARRGASVDWSRLAGAAGIAIPALDRFPPRIVDYLRRPHTALARADDPGGLLTLLVTQDAASRMLGQALQDAEPGSLGGTIRGDVSFFERATPYPARNVVASLPGRDPEVSGQFVAIGAHTDHEGVRASSIEHDSLRAFNTVVRPAGAENRNRSATPEELTRITSLLDSLRALRPGRSDSIMNGADDDASGSIAMLEIAEALAAAEQRPRRSILFVWHTAEEQGLLGADHFTRQPTVPRDSIVAQINLDMIGRGTADDLPGGGPHYLQIIGSRRLSTELGDLVETVNVDGGFGFEFDYQYDADGHPQRFYCRSDHYMYARFGIPIVFFSTGSHRDYHQVTDEAQYLDYSKMATVSRFVRQLTVTIANLDHRLTVDKPKPDPQARCRQ